MKRVYLYFFCIWIAYTLAPRLSAATFSFNYTDPPGFGYNDNTPVSPIGGNTGTTLGQQRQFLLEFAANKWATYLISDIEIVIEADFETVGGNSNSATLAFAGPYSTYTINNAPSPNTLYVSALADSLSGMDQDAFNPDISITVSD